MKFAGARMRLHAVHYEAATAAGSSGDGHTKPRWNDRPRSSPLDKDSSSVEGITRRCDDPRRDGRRR